MNKRICPDENTLSEYLAGTAPLDERLLVEVHLAECDACRSLVAETHSVLASEKRRESFLRLFARAFENLWLAASVVLLALSFAFPGYFLQFLVGASLAGIKWIVDSKTTRTLIMVHDAWKRGDKEKAEEILSRIDKDR